MSHFEAMSDMRAEVNEMKRIEKRVRELMAAGITHTFEYDGYTEFDMEPRHRGTAVDLWYMDKKIEAEKNNEWWSHYIPAHEIDGCTKEELWECVKIYAKSHEDNPVIRVKDGEGNVKIVRL